MELMDFVKCGFVDAHRNIGFAMDDLMEEVAHWQPPGTANSIASILAHVVRGEDAVINRSVNGGETLFDSGGWAAKTGIPSEISAIWEPSWRLNIAAFKDYLAAVSESADSCVAGLTAADLDREVPYGQSPQSMGFVLRRMVVTHMIGHAGEMSALKGMQGLNGLPM